MLVITRKPGQRVVIAGPGQHLVIEVGQLVTGRTAAFTLEGMPGYGEQRELVAVGASWGILPDIIVHVHEVTRGQAKLGIEAPRSLSIDREEVFLSKQKGGKR